MTRATEAQCQATLIAAATRAGWRVHAERPAQVRTGRWATNVQGHTGWPDLALAHPDRGFLLVELKRKPNRIEPAQQAWHDLLRAAGIDVQVWWVPEELDARCAWLQSARAHVRSGRMAGQSEARSTDLGSTSNGLLEQIGLPMTKDSTSPVEHLRVKP